MIQSSEAIMTAIYLEAENAPGKTSYVSGFNADIEKKVLEWYVKKV